MSIEAMTWALNADVGKPVHKLVLIGYANHAHKNGRNAWSSKETIAEYAGCSVKSVRRHVRDLIAWGWLREGDQAQVAHVRADRRPIVYDLAMNDATRAAWAAGSDPDTRGDNLSPRNYERPDSLTGREPDHGGTLLSGRDEGHGGTTEGRTGGQGSVPRTVRNQELPPHPPTADASGGARCARRGPTPHANCRGCGTTNRQVAERERREAAAAARAAEQARAAAARETAARTRVPTEDRPAETTAAIADARKQLAGARR